MSKNKWPKTASPVGMGTHKGIFQLHKKMDWNVCSLYYLQVFSSNIAWMCKTPKGRKSLWINSKRRTSEGFFSRSIFMIFFFFSLWSDISLKPKLSLGTHQLEQNSSLSLLTKLQTPEVYKSWNCIGNTYRHVAWIQATIYTPQEAGVYRGRHMVPPKALGVFPSFLMEARPVL